MSFSILRHRTAFSILCCTLSLFPPACVAAPVCKVPLSLNRNKLHGDYLMTQGLYPYKSDFEGYLVSIDGADLSKKSDCEIDNMLYGPCGTIKTFTILGLQNQLHETQEKCVPVIEANNIDREFPIPNFYLDYRTCNNTTKNINTSADIYTKAVHNLIAQKANELHLSSLGESSADLAAHAFIYYQLGDLDAGDRFMALSRKASKYDRAWDVIPPMADGTKISLLLAVGRPEVAADLFYGTFVDGKQDMMTGKGPFILASYFAEHGDKTRAVSVAEAFAKHSRSQFLPKIWFGEFYLRLGAIANAKQEYANTINKPSQIRTPWVADILLLRRALVGMAQVQFMQGDKSGAKASLLNAIEIGKHDFSSDVLAAIDKLPHQHPRVRDISNAITTIDAAKQFPSSIALPATHVGPALLPTENVLKAIRAGNEPAARKGANELLDRYRNSSSAEHASAENPNIYSHLMHLARRAKDRGWITLSTHILKALRAAARGVDAAPSTRTILQVELAYNGAEQLSVRGLREVALTYYYAGEVSRAKWLIDKALVDKSVDRTLSLIDAACIAAKQRDFVTASRYWKEICQDKAPRTLPFFATTRELCIQYIAAGKVEDAIKILKAAIEMPEEVPKFRGGKHIANIDLRFVLAKLYLDHGNKVEAYEIAKEAKASTVYLLPEHYQILGQCSSETNDPKAGVEHYLSLFQHSTESPTDRYFYLQKALELADRVPDYDRVKIADMCYRLSCVDLGQPDMRLQYAERAYKLMPESDPRKARMIGMLESLRHPNPSKPSVGMSERDKIRAQAARQLPPVVEAAKMAERNNQQQAHEMWLKAAVISAFALDPIRSELYARNALRCYSSQMYPLGQGVNILDRLLVLGYTDVAVRVLKAAIGRSRWVDGVKSNNLQNLYADGFSFYLALNRKDMASRMLDGALTCDMTTGPTRQQYISVSHCSPTPPNAVSVIKQILGALPDHELGKFSNNNWTKPASDDAFVLSSLQKILAAQKAALAPQDERMMPTLCALGYFYHRRKEYEKAQKFYDEAALMELNYQNHKDAGRALGKYFVENLKKVGRDKEAVLYGAQ